ncbi:MAG: TPM domain-containing protein [Bacteroidota bacterium]
MKTENIFAFFSPEDEANIIAAIQTAEKNTSGEIRVHLHEKIDKTLMKDAQKAFKKMGMHRTAARNGVLIFLVPFQKQFAILGDQGINEVVPEDFWDVVKEKMQTQFRAGKFVAGVCDGIQEVGAQLKSYFPYQSDDKNELPDEISY